MNHENDYAPDVNYGNKFADDWYFIRPEDSLQNNINQWTNMPAISDELYHELLREFEQDSRSYSSPILST